MPSIGKTTAVRLPKQFNFNHLAYFWAVGRAGSVTEAARRLGVSQPSVSEQVRTLERRLGCKLLERGARGVTLTAAGEVAMRYAEEVVGVCADLARSLPLSGRSETRPLQAGTADAVPKVVVRAILRPLLARVPGMRVVCREWRIDQLLSELSVHRLDMVIGDGPIEGGSGSGIRSYAAVPSGASLYAAPALARRLRRGYPASLTGAPLLLPAEGTSLRTAVDRWMLLHDVRGRVLVEAEDRALLHHFAEAGEGVVPVSDVTAKDVARQFGLQRVGRMPGVREDFHVMLIDREREHPALAHLRELLRTRGLEVGPGKRRP